MKFSIIVVSLNPGDELRATLKSIISQTYTDFEVIIKDGGSTDGSLQNLPDDDRIRLITSQDNGIYDAMNQALDEAKGEYVYFLNCGDYLYDETVLEKVSWKIKTATIEHVKDNEAARPFVIYGNIYDRVGSTNVMSNPVIDEFACFRNVPCHQACIYDTKMLRMHPFRIQYKVRADYEQFLWCFFYARAHMIYINQCIASYMGKGFSETKANRKVSAKEHREIVEIYMQHKNVVKYKWRMRLSMAHLRGFIAKNPITARMYNKLKARVYKKRIKE